ncbi:MAG: TatD family hydrolase [Candidatus Paceibacterota bacterium]|jgi:TatD DNase family protein
MKFIDAHTHAQFSAFKDDREEVMKRALGAGVAVVNVGTQKDTSKKAVEVANNFSDGVYAVIGMHPIHTGKSFYDVDELGDIPGGKGFTTRGEDFDYEYYKELAMDKKVVAIGECGLDYYRATSDIGNETKAKQKEVFIKQIKLAKEVEKPLMIHCRDAYPDLLEVLKSNQKSLNSVPGILHFYSGDLAQTKELLEMGFYFTFGGVITFTRSYDEVVKLIPMDRILSETDAPYVAPAPYRGKRNEPAYVVEVVKKIAEIKGVSMDEMAAQIWKNAQAIFQI